MCVKDLSSYFVCLFLPSDWFYIINYSTNIWASFPLLIEQNTVAVTIVLPRHIWEDIFGWNWVVLVDLVIYTLLMEENYMKLVGETTTMSKVKVNSSSTFNDLLFGRSTRSDSFCTSYRPQTSNYHKQWYVLWFLHFHFFTNTKPKLYRSVKLGHVNYVINWKWNNVCG